MVNKEIAFRIFYIKKKKKLFKCLHSYTQEQLDLSSVLVAMHVEHSLAYIVASYWTKEKLEMLFGPVNLN